MTIRIPKELWFYNQSKEIRSVRWMGKKLCLELTILSFGLWSKHFSLYFLTVTPRPPSPATHTLIPQLNDTNVKKKKTWPTKSNNSTTLRAQDYNVRPIRRIRKISNQRFQGYFPSSHIIFIICQYLLIICYK